MSQLSDLEIVRLRRDQFVAARQMLTRAFLDYPLMVYANSELERRRRGVATLYGAIVRDTLRHGEVHVSAGLEGACCWLPPGVGLPSFAREVRSGMLGLPLGFGWAGFQRLVDFDHVQRRLHEKYAIGPHWFLATIGVDPAHQGRGIGSALIAPVLARADEQRIPCYLETHTTGNVRLYERHGFRVVEHIENPTSVPLWAMLRAPAGT
ncbi:MAG TPA: GNAT family N-acetyltransferase [Planctomycetaceae bacterium]|jgi:ribosomal protein S18 acetylase RimI-like enzyme|nr:GNAT family N-acetyltransferase [Planctomycetaceae bacterium]